MLRRLKQILLAIFTALLVAICFPFAVVFLCFFDNDL